MFLGPVCGIVSGQIAARTDWIFVFLLSMELGTSVARADVFSSFSMRNSELEKLKHLGVSWQWKLFRS